MHCCLLGGAAGQEEEEGQAAQLHAAAEEGEAPHALVVVPARGVREGESERES